MKKIVLPLLCLLYLTSEAKTWNVSVQDYQFSPQTLNVVVGDIIHWEWVNGVHTTSSVSIPKDADSWDSPITTGNSSFDYVVTVPGAYSYQCNIHAFVMKGSFVVSTPLSVTLSTFEISNVNEKPVVKWTTESEMNVDYFSIRKSINGTDFKEIAKEPSAGNSSEEKKYAFTDGAVPATVKYLYYTLAIVDKDGKTELAPIKVYKNNLAKTKLITSISPNPINSMGHLMLQFNADKPGILKVQMSDIQGRIIYQTELTAVTGINNGHLQLSNIPAGSYTLFFIMDDIKESYRIMKE